jgi:multicomponent Na+:H+ antiporter subunit E
MILLLFIIHAGLTVAGTIWLGNLLASGLWIDLVLIAGLFLMLWLLSFPLSRRYFRLIRTSIDLLLFFNIELFRSSFKVAWEVIHPKSSIDPGVVAYPLQVKKDWQITLLANLISLTPGTLSIDINEERTVLYFHVVFLESGNIESKIDEIRNGFERKILNLST